MILAAPAANPEFVWSLIVPLIGSVLVFVAAVVAVRESYGQLREAERISALLETMPSSRSRDYLEENRTDILVRRALLRDSPSYAERNIAGWVFLVVAFLAFVYWVLLYIVKAPTAWQLWSYFAAVGLAIIGMFFHVWRANSRGVWMRQEREWRGLPKARELATKVRVAKRRKVLDDDPGEKSVL